MDIPIYVFFGVQAPVCRCSRNRGLQLLSLFEKLRFSHVLAMLYPEGRHEMLNETNRDEVTADVIQWLNQQESR